MKDKLYNIKWYLSNCYIDIMFNLTFLFLVGSVVILVFFLVLQVFGYV